MAICYVIGAATRCGTFAPQPDDCVIAADGGLAHLRRLGIQPTVVVGDFDSLASPPQGDNVVVYPVEKDDTDTMLAIKCGWARGFREFRLLACTGGRTDHTLANMQALAWLAARGGRGVLMGEGECFTVIRNGSVRFCAREEGILSVFAHGGDARGVTLAGLQYPLTDAVLSPHFPLGVSNHFVGLPVTVSVSDGMLLIYWQGDISEML